ncbi:hypothetical protein FCV25MIE_14794 [Fagus crenata]
MSLTAKEDLRVELSGEHGVTGGVLAAMFLTKHIINIEAVMRTLRSLWWAKGSLQGCNMGNNRVMFLFVNTVGMEWVIANGPWSFDKFLILLKRVDDDSSFSKVVFDSCAFWVPLHDLPPCHMSTAVCGKIGSTLGTVEQVEELDEGRNQGNFMRACITVEVA